MFPVWELGIEMRLKRPGPAANEPGAIIELRPQKKDNAPLVGRGVRGQSAGELQGVLGEYRLVTGVLPLFQDSRELGQCLGFHPPQHCNALDFFNIHFRSIRVCRRPRLCFSSLGSRFWFRTGLVYQRLSVCRSGLGWCQAFTAVHRF